jgi:hypothetical protein
MKNQDFEKLPVRAQQTNKDYTYSFESSKPPKQIFKTLLEASGWWSGLYSEKFGGTSGILNEEFTFVAGGGAHRTKQRLIELIPDKRIVWLVVESNLNFLKNPGEWTGTRISFDILSKGNKRQVRFTHAGLVPSLESYDGCASAWTQYMNRLAIGLK